MPEENEYEVGELKGTFVPRGYDENNPEGVPIDGQPPEPSAPAATPDETPEPAAVDAPVPEQMPEPPAADLQPPVFDDLFKERLGFSVQEVEAMLGEVETLKKRNFVDDPMFVADDEFSKNFMQVYKNGGNVLEFVEAAKTDYTKMSVEEIVKYDIRKATPGIPEHLVNLKYARVRGDLGWSESLEAGTPEERDFNEAMEWQANEIRKKYVEQGKKFAIPERKIPESQPQPDIAAQVAKNRADLMAEPAMISLMQAKKISYGGTEFVVDPGKILEMAADFSQVSKYLLKPDGTIDHPKLFKWLGFLPDMDTIDKKVPSNSTAQGKLEIIKEIKNPSDALPAKPEHNGRKTIDWGV